MEKRKLRKVFFIAAILSLTAAGCSAGGLESTAVIKAAAFDISGGGFTLTSCILNPDGEDAYITESVEAESMTEAISRLSAATERRPFFSQCDVIIFSETLARRGIGDMLDWFYHSEEGRDGMLVAISRGEAKKVFTYTDELHRDTVGDISRTIRSASDTGTQILASLKDTKLSMSSPSGASLLPVCEVTDEEEKGFFVKTAGIMKDGALIGELDENERLGVKCIKSSAEGSHFFSDGAGFEIMECEAEISEESVRIKAGYRVEEGDFTARDDRSETVERFIKNAVISALSRAEETDFLGFYTAGRLKKGAEVSVFAKMKGGGYPPHGTF